MVINVCNTTENHGFDLPSIKQLGHSSRGVTTAEEHGNEFQCQVTKVQTSLLPPWLAVDDGEWRPSGDLHICVDYPLIPCIE
jgi:hypothetical protein